VASVPAAEPADVAALLVHSSAICRKKTRRGRALLDARALTHCLPRKNSRGVANSTGAAGGHWVNRRRNGEPYVSTDRTGVLNWTSLHVSGQAGRKGWTRKHSSDANALETRSENLAGLTLSTKRLPFEICPPSQTHSPRTGRNTG
jgi:hypothetical protein